MNSLLLVINFEMYFCTFVAAVSIASPLNARTTYPDAGIECGDDAADSGST
jgi:hypothetical protein